MHFLTLLVNLRILFSVFHIYKICITAKFVRKKTSKIVNNYQFIIPSKDFKCISNITKCLFQKKYINIFNITTL